MGVGVDSRTVETSEDVSDLFTYNETSIGEFRN